MAVKRGEHLSRLSIAPNLNMQQPMGGMFSPALPTSLQQGFHPAFPMANPLQTPMQSFFNQPILGAPGRPTHNPHQASIQLAAAGIHPPNLGPPPHAFMTPVTGHFPRSSISLGPGGIPQPPSHPFPARNRRQLSIGGPPKAILGGPARKVSPMPVAAAPGIPASPQPTSSVPEKKRKVNLPKETVVSEDGESKTRPEWARYPVRGDDSLYDAAVVIPAEISTGEIYPPDSWRSELPNTIDVYLPGKLAWEAIKHKDIEEKLERLGVERGSGSNVPHIHAPHARAASISSPADPALLLFKLNKLHQAQEATSSAGGTSNNSLSVSPQPPFIQPFGLSPSPHRLITNRHGHTMSLANPVPYQPSLFPPSPGTLSGVVEGEFGGDIPPQSRLSLSAPEFIPPPLSAVGAPKAQIDFIRGFGLDVPLESEEEEEAEAENQRAVVDTEDEGIEEADKTQDMDLDDDDELHGGLAVEIDDSTTTAPDSRYHSRHVSRISAALSLRSVGGNFQAQFENAQKDMEESKRVDEVVPAVQEVEEAVGDEEQQDDVPGPVDPVEEWTGSEDAYHSSDDESIGEYSNPSDEERARQVRNERRLRRRTDQPRRIPDFPRPPATSHLFGAHTDDEIISNPSEENLIMAQRADFMGVRTEQYHPDTASNLGLHIPHSRVASGQYSAHDPARAHSRQPSEQFTYPGRNPSGTMHLSTSSGPKNLNPFAKPFVFGSARVSASQGGSKPGSGSWQPFAGESTPPMPVPNVSSHSRVPSLGKPLSAAAPEFKPGGFSFRLPGAPQMPIAEPGVAPEPSIVVPPPMPIPVPTISDLDEDEITAESSPFRVQGREKRQRVDSINSVEEGDSLSSFRFPPLKESSPKAIRRHRSGELFSSSGENKPRLNPSAQPFTFAGFSAVANNMPRMPEKDSPMAEVGFGRMRMPEPELAEVGGDSTLKPALVLDLDEGQDIEFPQLSGPRRAPIPLDFKHPASATVPAGLFKALANGEERTRRGARSRLSSREIFDHIHRPSMDDTNIALISRKASRNQLVADISPKVVDDDVFSSVRPHARRRSSLPDALVDLEESPTPSELSVGPQDLTTRMELHRLENVVAQIMDEKLAPLREDLQNREVRGEAGVSAAMETLLADVVDVFRAQLQESARKNLEDSQMDARGELDFQMLKDIIQQSHKELLSAFQRDIHRISQQSAVANGHGHNPEILNAVDSIGTRTVNAVVEAISELSARQEAVALNTPARERDLTVEKVVTVLTPLLKSLRTDPVDHEFLTRELSQAVKPHLAQLIDLASDKRETASLIVNQILPLLPSLNNITIDTDAITTKLVTEVRRAIAPIDAFEIKEQVADLVVERLDSRLAVRDKAFNVDAVTSKIADSVSKIMEPLNGLPTAVQQLAENRKVAEEQSKALTTSQSQILSAISDVPSKVGAQLEQFKTTRDSIVEKLSAPPIVPEPDVNVLAIRTAVESLKSEQEKALLQNNEATSHISALATKLDGLPDTVSALVAGLQKTLTDLITSSDNSKRELEDARKLNTEYQVQLTKARSSHGQARVEKDMINEKLAMMEADRDRLRAQVKELQTAASSRTSETSALEVRNKELEDALSKALARLQSTDVAAEASQRAVAELEKANKALSADQDALKTKVATFEADALIARRESESSAKNLEALQERYDQLSSQQGSWDALNAASEKINMVHKLLMNAEEEDQQELRQQRDRSRALDAENQALQKRLKDFELRLTNAEKVANTTRQTLTQAQQRSTEWERRAKEYEGELEMANTKLDQAEQTHSQLEQDHHLAKMQVEEMEANSRLVQDKEMKFKEQVSALEAKVARLQAELERATKVAHSPFRPENGTTAYPTPSRPDSRASTAYDPAPRRITSLASNPNRREPSVWDSIHAPATNGHVNGHVQQNGQTKWGTPVSANPPSSRYSSYVPSTPKARPSVYQYQRGAPSPTPSIVSAAPTQGEDGWWS